MKSSNRVTVFSTLATDQRYVQWAKGGGDMNIQEHSILIKGGTGVANDRFITPLGVATEIDADLLPILEQNPVFQVHSKNGYIVVQRQSADPEKVAADMNLSDPSAPKTPADFPADGNEATVAEGAKKGKRNA
jgi:hypothetical protein